jgi:hypothetical protein
MCSKSNCDVLYTGLLSICCNRQRSGVNRARQIQLSNRRKQNMNEVYEALATPKVDNVGDLWIHMNSNYANRAVTHLMLETFTTQKIYKTSQFFLPLYIFFYFLPQ